MQLVLERRAERSALIAVASPLIAIALTLVTMSVLFALLGKNPVYALYVYFVQPLTDAYTLQEIAVKATPLVMIGVGLCALLHRQCLEHRRRRAVHHRRRGGQLASPCIRKAPTPVIGCCRRC